MGSWTCWLTGACTTHCGKIIGNLIIIAVCCTQRTKTFLFGLLIYIRTNRLYSLFYFSRTFFLSSLFASTLVDSESRSAYCANIERHAHRTCKYFRFQLEFVFTFPLPCTQYVDGGNLDVYLLGELKKELIAIRTETATESALFRFYSPVSFFFNSVWNVPLCRSLSSLPFLFYRPSIRRRFHKYSQTLKKIRQQLFAQDLTGSGRYISVTCSSASIGRSRSPGREQTSRQSAQVYYLKGRKNQQGE